IGTVVGTTLGLLIGVFRSVPESGNALTRFFQKIGNALLSIYVQARKEYEQQLEELLNRTNQATTESSMENSKESDPSKAKEGSS
ncbi:hypothetical protein, partial [Enterococcus faecium]|uniref:hypothetical protein n=1 Tax=Enterococcus faecium TaxID=1352 RepID=UPI0039772955